MLCNFYFAKSHKTANNLVTTEARKKIITDLESLELFDARLTEFENYQILQIKISHQLLVTIKLLSGWNSLIIVKYN